MIRKLLLGILPIAMIALFTSEKMSDNGKAGYTGSPGEQTCTNCHSDFALNSGVWLNCNWQSGYDQLGISP